MPVLASLPSYTAGSELNLTWSDVDLHQGRITLHHTKNNERRVVPLVGKALELLKAHNKVRRIDTRTPRPCRNRTSSGPRGPWMRGSHSRRDSCRATG